MRPARWSRRGLLALALPLAFAGCPKPTPETRPSLVETPTVAPTPTGRVVGDAYIDNTYPLVVPVPRGWIATPGSDAGAVRVVLQDPDGDVVVSVVGTPGDTLAPRPLPGCAWTFTDIARYRVVKVRGDVLAATCTPDDADDPRVLAYVVAFEGMLWQVEGRVTPGRLRPGKADLDMVAAGVRFR
ncbi:MAG: hypothetical protein Q8P41_13505 [Pseudomonadota bacterium]|nr:hypothetical protein [Pseudomonadota bacterium]